MSERESRKCRFCRNVLVRKPREKASGFAVRDTCNKVCSNRQKAVDRELKKSKGGKRARSVSGSDVAFAPAVAVAQPLPADDARSRLNQEMLRQRMYRGAVV